MIVKEGSLWVAVAESGRRMGAYKTRSVLLAAALLGGCAALQPPETTMIQQSRYVELERYMESQIPDQRAAPTAKLLYLCFAYARVKNYAKLFPCVDNLQRNIDRGDTRLYVFDFTSAPAVIRAEAFMDLGDYEKAASWAEKSVRQTDNPDTTYLQMRIYALTAAGLSRALAGNAAQARRYAALLEAVDTSYPNTLMATDKYTGLARVYLALGENRLAIEALRRDSETEGLKAFADLVSGAGLAGQSLFTYWELPKQIMLNRALFGLGDLKAAKAGYDKLLALPQLAEDGGLHWRALFDRGRIAEAEGDLAAAVDFFRRAIEVIERQRSTIDTEASKIGFVADKQDLYAHVVGGLLALKRPAAAFEYAERAKARALVDLLAERRAIRPKAADAGAAAALVEKLGRLEADYLAQDRPPGSGNGASGRLRRAEALDAARRELAEKDPELASLVTVGGVDARRIRAALRPDEGLVEYFGHGDALYAFWVTRQGVRGHVLKGDGIERETLLFRDALERRDGGDAGKAARYLSERLIAPVAGDIAGKRRLTIVPHGVLHYLPFEALPAGAGLLIDGHVVRVLPSASVIAFLGQPAGRGKRPLLALGNPDLGDRQYDLPGAEREARAIGGVWPGAKLALRRAATETLVKTAGDAFAILHLASHGKFSADAPLQSGMMLVADAANDGRLTVGELYGLRLGAELVTLSACETGIGKVKSGDDVVGLTRGFLYAGAGSVVASLWPVADEATSYLMVRFYRDLATRDVGEALRQAKLATRQKFKDPVFWAPFGLTGRW